MRIHDDKSTGQNPPERGNHGGLAPRRPASSAIGPAGLGGMPPAALLALQRAVGNAVVARSIESEQHAHDDSCAHGAAVQRSGVQDVLGSSGTPLAVPVRSDMEARLGADFSDVRVHTGTAARRSAAEIGARAYTSGNNVVIGAGGADDLTLAHELTHVIQQRRGPVAGTDNGSGLRVSDPSDRFEREAEANAHRVMSEPAPRAAGHPEAERTAGRPRTAQDGEVDVQRANDRSANPHGAGGQSHDSWELTAHHIVPHTALKNGLASLLPADRMDVLIHAVPGTITRDMIRNIGLSDEQKLAKVNTVKLRKELVDPANTTADAVDGITYNEMREAFFEWQGGNQFLGPNTSIRPEPSSDKDGIDVDGRYFVPSSSTGLRQGFDRLVSKGTALKESLKGGPGTDEQKRLRARILMDILDLTKDVVPGRFIPADWQEITDSAQVMALADHAGLGRGHLAKYAFFKIETERIEQICPKIVKEGAEFHEVEGPGDNSYDWPRHAGESRKRINGSLLLVKGPATYLNMDRLEGSHPELYRFCLDRGIPTSTYLPKELYDKLGLR